MIHVVTITDAVKCLNCTRKRPRESEHIRFRNAQGGAIRKLDIETVERGLAERLRWNGCHSIPKPERCAVAPPVSVPNASYRELDDDHVKLGRTNDLLQNGVVQRNASVEGPKDDIRAQTSYRR